MPALAPSPAAIPSQQEQEAAPETAQPFGPTSGIPHPIPVPTKQADWDSGYQNEHGPRPSRWDSWVAAPFQEGAHATIASPFGGALLRMAQIDNSASGKTISPDEANKMFPGRPVPYTTPVDQGTALMEFNDRQKQAQLSDWAAQRPMTNMGKVVSTASGFVGGLTDPLNFAIGAMSGGVGDLLAPEAAGLAGKVAAHYLANLGGFSAADALQNMAEMRMGAKQKQISEVIGENVVPAAVMTGIGVGLSTLARHWANEGGGTSEADIAGIKKTVTALESDQRVPQLEDQRNMLADRRNGVSLPNGPGSPEAKPTLLTSPIQETPLYGATHSDGTPLIHEHGLGPGTQLTDSHEVANNGVSRSTETPGQIHETKLPEGAKTLDIDQSAAQDYNSPKSLLKQIEEKIGIPLEQDTKGGTTLKDVITKLGDWAGTELQDGTKIPEDVLSQIQEVAKSQGYSGYEFAGENSRQVHVFDTDGMSVDKSYSANPETTPTMPEPEQATPPKGGQPAQAENPAEAKTQQSSYSPEIEKLAREFRKGKTFDPYSPEALADTQKDIEAYKQQMADLAKTSDTAAEAFEDLRKQEAQDSRLRDIAKRIAECGQGGGL